MDTKGIITTIAGTGVKGYSGDNGPATQAKLNFPRGIAFDSKGDLFIADSENKRIRKLVKVSVCQKIIPRLPYENISSPVLQTPTPQLQQTQPEGPGELPVQQE